MNKVFLIGNLTRDPELSETNSGVSLCRFAIAVNRRFSGGDAERQTDFFNVTAFRGLADNIARFCKKGTKSRLWAASRSATMRTTTGSAAPL